MSTDRLKESIKSIIDTFELPESYKPDRAKELAITIWLPIDVKEMYDLTQVKTGREFSKLFRATAIKIIEKAYEESA